MGVELHRQFPFIDFVCSGEGDLNFPELAATVLSERPLIEFDGIITRDAESETVVPQRMVCPVEMMDWLPVPSFDDYFSQLQALGLEEKVEPVIPVETARGCWWGAKNHCTFCGLNGSTMSFRSKSPMRALEEIEQLGRYGKEFLVTDNIIDLKYLETVIPALAERNSGHKFHYETKVNLRKRHLRLLAEAGVTNLQPGIESLSTSVLKLMRKGCTFLQNIQFLKWSKQYGITAIWNFLYGFPGEDPAEYERVAELVPSLVHLRPPEICTAVRFDRFSPYFMQPESFGIRNRRSHYAYGCIYPFQEHELDNIAYYFNYDFDAKPVVESYAKPAVDAIADWQNHDGEASLDAKLDGGELVIMDTRPGSPVTRHRLCGIDREIYLFCDESRSVAAIQQRFPETERRDLQELLARWIQHRLMLSEGNQYLALAVLRFEPQEQARSYPMVAHSELRILG